MFLLTGKPEMVSAIWNAHTDYYKAIPSLKLKRNEIEILSGAEVSANSS